MKLSEHPSWVYLPPALHLGACLVSLSGYVFPKLQALGIVWVGIMLVDVPVSALAYLTAWKDSAFSVVWVIVMGTLWWYVLARLFAKAAGGRASTSSRPEPTENSCQGPKFVTFAASASFGRVAHRSLTRGGPYISSSFDEMCGIASRRRILVNTANLSLSPHLAHSMANTNFVTVSHLPHSICYAG